MAEEVKLMKGNEGSRMPPYAMVPTDISAILLPRNRKSWEPLWKKSRGKRPAWLCCKPRAK